MQLRPFRQRSGPRFPFLRPSRNAWWSSVSATQVQPYI